MSTQTDSPVADHLSTPTQASDEPAPPTHARGRRKFIEPEVSAPVNVLEATTFFQAATSGVTNP